MRLLPFIIAAVTVSVIIYSVGRRFGLWGRPKSKLKPKKQAAPVTPAKREGAHDDLDPSYGLASDLWQEARIQPHDTWLYTRQDRMLRVSILAVEGKDTLYIEVVTCEQYLGRVTAGSATVEVFSFPHGRDAAALVRTVRVKPGGPPDYTLGHAKDATEGTGSEKPAPDRLRKLKTDLQLAAAPPD